MDAKIALDKIQEAEQEAQRLIEQAKKEAVDILHKTGQGKEQIIHQAREQAGRDARKLKEDTTALTAQEVFAIEKQGEQQIRTLRETESGKVNKAIQFLKNKLGL
ncbi:MAG: hypothetical protein V1662_00430 [Candidatus Omnitrophota bacterium]